MQKQYEKKINLKKIYKLSKVDPWFLEQIKEIVDEENKILLIAEAIRKKINLKKNIQIIKSRSLVLRTN